MPAPSSDTVEVAARRGALVHRAQKLVLEHLVPGALGALLSGTSVYPGTPPADCDLDIFAVVEDAAYERIPPRKRSVLVVDPGPPRRKTADIGYVSVAETEEWVTAARDAWHWQLQYMAILHDPQDLMRSLVQRGAALPDGVREERMRVHYAELAYSAAKAKSRLASGDTAHVPIVVAIGVRAALKLLAVARGSWAPLTHCMWDALREIGVSAAVVDVALRASRDPAAGLDELLTATESWLSECGHQFHHNPFQLKGWLYSAEGRAAQERWAHQM